jgi:hypothetical protein
LIFHFKYSAAPIDGSRVNIAKRRRMARFQIRFATLSVAIAVILLAISGCNESPSAADINATHEIASSSSEPAAATNAALAYARIDQAMGDAFFDPLVNMSATAAPSPAESAYLRSKQPIVRDLLAASQLPECRFSTDYSQGLNVMMPHLLWGRNFAKLLQYDAVRVLHEERDGSGAAARLVAILRISDDIAGEPVALAKLVALGGIDLALQTIVQSSGALTTARDREMLVNELRRVEAGPTFEFKTMLAREAEMAKMSIGRGESVSPGIDGNEVVVPADARVGTIAEIERVLREIEKVWNLPRAEQEIKRHSDQARLAMAKPFVAGYDALRKRSRDTQAKIQATIKTLQGPASR